MGELGLVWRLLWWRPRLQGWLNGGKFVVCKGGANPCWHVICCVFQLLTNTLFFSGLLPRAYTPAWSRVLLPFPSPPPSPRFAPPHLWSCDHSTLVLCPLPPSPHNFLWYKVRALFTLPPVAFFDKRGHNAPNPTTLTCRTRHGQCLPFRHLPRTRHPRSCSPTEAKTATVRRRRRPARAPRPPRPQHPRWCRWT